MRDSGPDNQKGAAPWPAERAQILFSSPAARPGSAAPPRSACTMPDCACTRQPGGAFYHASKYAVEAFSDALRMEVAQFGIEVVLIEPGPVRTPWDDTAAGSLGETAVGSGTDPYAANKAADGVSFSRAASGLLARLGSDAHDIAKVITRAVTVQRPRTRYLI